MDNNVIKAALLGLGTVGTGVYKVFQLQDPDMKNKLNADVRIKKILVRNLEKAAKKVADPSVLTNNWQEIIDDPDISIIIEVMGGLKPAGDYIRQALEKGKYVVTANKDLIAEEGDELIALAEENKTDILFEAAVAGGIPVIGPLKHSLAANYINEIVGIVNGTTNFILTKMTQEHMDFTQALKIATDLGYAEADPTADIEGLDAGRKVAILASLAFNSKVTFADVYTEGITQLTPKDIESADEFGYVIKLIGLARWTAEGVEARVHPMLIPKSHPLSTVSDSYNALFIHGDAVGDVMFYGRGAGEMPTASAIMGDVFDIARAIACGGRKTARRATFRKLPVKGIQDSVNRQGNSGVNEALRKRFLKMHTQDHQVVIPRTQFLIHPVDEVTEMEIMKIVHDNRDHPTAAGAQGRGRRVRNISHLVRSIPDQAARGLGNMLVTAKGS